MTEGDERSVRQRNADGLYDLAARALAHGDLPDHAGERPQVVVTIPLSELRDGIEANQLPTGTVNGHSISPETARLLACDAGIIPAVLGSRGEVLDLGRSQRPWSVAQRRAARLRDNGCVWPDCQAGLDRCDLHHLLFWALGGRSDLGNSAHLCHFHHWLVHHKNWKIWRDSFGKIRICRT